MSRSLVRASALALCALLVSSPFATAQSVLKTVHGNSASDTFGQSIDIVGDVDGDGFDDYMVGAWRDDDNGNDAGTVRVVSGKDGTTIYSIDGDLPGDHMGYGSSGAGDVNGDGFADICAAADEANVGGVSNIGSAKIVSGQNGSVIHFVTGTNANDLFGWSSAIAGDVDGDGFDDVLIGALLDDAPGLSGCGSATLISGQTGNVLYTLFGGAANDNLGDDVGCAGDTNGDGFIDMIAGAPSADPNGGASGRATIFSGSDGSVLFHIDGNSAGDRLGDSVDGGVDVDGDGFTDLVVGAPQDDPGALSNAGTVRVVSGRTHVTLHTFSGDNAGDQLGGAVHGVNDANRDGYADVIAGARADDNNGNSSGSVRIWSGRDGAVMVTLSGDSAGDQLGSSVSAGGDLNNDGWPDVVAGATGDDNGGNGSGSARAWSLIPKGITPFGPGSPGCDGPQSLMANSVPSIGNAGFALIGATGPANTGGYLLVSDVPDGAGSDPFGVSALFHLKVPPAATLFALLPSTQDAIGSTLTALPLPNLASLINFNVYVQHASVWPGPCPGLGAQNVSTSNGMRITIQP